MPIATDMTQPLSCVVALPSGALSAERARTVLGTLDAHGWTRVTLLEDPASKGVLVHASGAVTDLLVLVDALPDDAPTKHKTLARLRAELHRVDGGR